jgi:hypothetical protein
MDHPLTDIINHQIPTFSPEIDELIRRLNRLIRPSDLDEIFYRCCTKPLPEFQAELEAALGRANRQSK